MSYTELREEIAEIDEDVDLLDERLADLREDVDLLQARIEHLGLDLQQLRAEARSAFCRLAILAVQHWARHGAISTDGGGS